MGFAKFATSVVIVVCLSLTSAMPMLHSRAISDPFVFPSLHRAATLSSAAYSGCSGSAFDITITKQINDPITDTQGFIGYSGEKEAIVVVARGSTSPTDFFNDLNTVLVTPKLSGVAFPSEAKVMAGISIPWSAVHDEVMVEVKRLVQKYPTYTLESIGHSLGGSLTYLSYIALAQNFPGKSLTGYALAAFPIGNKEFADFGNAQSGTMNRGNNKGDGVPNMYVIPQGFHHFGTEYYSSGAAIGTIQCEGERDTSCSAGNGMYGVTPQHVASFGVVQMTAGCGH
ncbi:hypothetical protein BDV24DRAFT_174391 [Aspergillus arachidicola]|uniref:feruloyl esterase n=1 Tax=Aspergillus arachidicola TaxID=656916 RepID=A0A5N6XR86_9EURO|nr:hypothetical protein BDV24DRAFT_174391 [Aspergillus arachidicola]